MRRSSDLPRRRGQPATAGHGTVAPRTDALDAPAIVHDVLRTSGRPLDDATRGFMEQRFEHDFSQVRVHHDSQAAASAEAVDALAYTVGRHVVFGAGQYRPVDDQGRQLIAHELTHVVHQGGAEYAAGPLSVSRPDDAAETEASAVAAAVRAGSSNAVAHDHTAAHTAALFRQPKPQQQQQPTPAQNYQQALTTIQQKDAEVYRFLTGTSLNSKTKVHGGAITDTSTTPATTITFVFNLNVTTASLAAGRDAVFDGGVPVFGGKDTARTFTADMTMQVSSNVTSSAGAMAEALYHEAIHMLLFIEDLIPSSPTSKHATSFAGYKSTAAASAKTATTLGDLEAYMSRDWTTRKVASPPNPKKAAKEVLDHIVEEKYAFDQERVQFGKGPSNTTLVDGYLKDGFRDMNITFDATSKTLQGIASGLAAILDDIDRATSAKAKPAPAQKPPAQTPQKPAKKP